MQGVHRSIAAILRTPWHREVSANFAVQFTDERWQLAKHSPTMMGADRWRATAPGTADGSYRVTGVHEAAADEWVTITPQGRRTESRGHATGNVVLYADAAGQGGAPQDVAVALLPHKLEEFVVAHELPPDGTVELRYSVSYGSGIQGATVRPGKQGTVDFVDGLGRGFARLPAAWAVDGTGVRRALELKVLDSAESGEGGAKEARQLAVVLTLETAGLVPPVVIDPAWTFGPGFPQETITAFTSFDCEECSDVFGDVAVVGGSGSATVGTLDASNIWGDLSAASINVGANGWLRADAYALPGGYSLAPGGLINQPYTAWFPLTHAVPTIPSFVAGDEDAEPGELEPGSYGDVLVHEDDARFLNGVYNLRSLELAEGAVLSCDDYCEVRVEESVLIREGATLTGAFVIYVAGADQGSQLAFESLAGSRVEGGLVAAPNGTIELGAEQQHEGRFVADVVVVGSDAVVNGAMAATIDYDCASFCAQQDAKGCNAWSGYAACVAACDSAMVEPDCVAFKRGLVDCWNRSTGAAYCDNSDLPAKVHCEDEQANYDTCVAVCAEKDDENECTRDVCSCIPGDCKAGTAIVHPFVADGSDCGWGGGGDSSCGGVFACFEGQCAVVVPPVDPDDSNPCTVDSCDDGAAVNVPAALGASCETDDDACNGVSRCDGTATCVPGSALTPAELDDGNPCTADSCSATTGQVEHAAVADGIACGDGDACNGAETCQSGVCTAGSPVVLEDGDPLTVDVCHDVGGVATIIHATPPTTEELRDTIAPGATMHALARYIVDEGLQVPVGETKAALLARLDAEPHRVAIITGRVVDATGAPAANVSVHAKTYEDASREYGVTRTQASGRFELVVLGQEKPMLIEMSKPGHLQVHRKVLALPDATAALDNDVVLTEKGALMTRPAELPPLEPSLPYVVLGPQSPLQVLEGELEDDVVGSAPPGATRARRPILIFKPGTQAEVVTYPSGGSPEQRVATTTLKLRQREFTTGSDGPLAMPAPLPPTSAYTYALEFTADEVEAAGADTVEFTNQPVIMYVDDFWGFDAGSIVPLGYYNRHLGRWEAEGDGVSLLLLPETGGLARLSHDGSTEMEPAEYASLGIDEEERSLLGTLYQPGKVVWRIPVDHFSPLDPNGFPERGNDQCVPDDGDCSLPDPVADNGEDDPNCTAGSVIECQNRTLRQTVGVAGTPYTLNYRSDRTPAFKRPYRIKAYLSGNTPPTAIAMRAQLFVAGAMLDEHVVPCASGNCPANETYTFEWDGKTEVGATVGAPVRATVKVSYRYAPPAPILPGVIVAGGSVGGGTGSGSGGGAVGSSFASWPVRDDVEISYVDLNQGATEPPREFWVSRSYRLTIGTLDARVGGLGGWSLSPHHSYIPGARALYRGDGTLRFADTAEPVSEVFAPDDALSFDPQGLALSRDGRWLYIADRKHCVRRMSTVDQSFEVVAGTCGGSGGYGGDGQNALAAALDTPRGIAVGPDDDVYFSDAGNHCIRRIDADTGVIETVAGVPTQPGGGDHVALATTMQLSAPRGIAVDDDGTLYIADNGNNRVVAVLSSGLATTVAGDVFLGTAQRPTVSQGTDALNLLLHNVYDVDISTAGDLFVVDRGASQSDFSSWVLRVDLAGATAHMFLGSGSRALTHSNFGYGGPGENALVAEPRSVTADVRGNVYVVAVDVQQGTPQNPGVWAYGDGEARVVVGGDGTRNPSFRTGVGAVAQELGLYRARELAVASDGTMYIADEDYGGVIVRLDAIFPSTPVGDYHIPSEDGSMVYHFDAAGRHLDTVDAVNNRVLFQFGYDPSHPSRLTSITDAEGRMTTISHSLGEAQITSPFLHTTKVKMVGTSWATEIEDPLQRKTVLDYTMGPSLVKTGLLSSFTTPGQTLAKTYAYDTDGLLEDAGTPGGLTSKNFVTTENGTVETVTMTTATGLQTAYSIEQTQAELQTWTVTRPDGTNVVSTRNEDGTRTMVRNDTSSVSLKTEPATAGRLKMATPKRTVVYKSKQTGGKTLTVVSDEEAVEATDDGNPLTFDALTTTAKVWVGTTTTGSPDRQSTTVFDLDGSICGLTERCLQTTTPEGRVLRRTVDAAGRVLRELAPAGTISLADVEYTYYDTGLLTGYLKEIIAAPGTPDERKYLFEYDTSGRLQKVTDPLGQVTQYAYDAADQLLTSTLPSTEVIGFGYTDDGQLNLVDPPGSGTSNQHTMGYDRFMLMDAYTTPAVGMLPRDSVYTFDDDRRLDDKTMPSGDTIDWKYNALGKLYEVDVPTSTPSDALGDDLGLAYFTTGEQQGKLQHITAGGTTVAFGFQGSLMTSTTLSLASPTVSQTVAWTHDDFLRIASEQVGTGPQIDFTYDDDDLLTGAHVTGQPADGVVMTRDPSTGLLTEVRSGSGTSELVTTYAYNTFGEITSMRTERSTTPTSTLIYEVVYDRDPLGRVAYKTETTSGGIESWGYTYDLEGRLVEVAHGTGQSCKDATPACSPIEAYGYDANGNRTHQGTSLATLALIGTYDHRDRIVTYDGESYVYDDNGMLKQKGSGPNATHYDYDLFGNLRKVTLPSGATITYTIDGLGRRVGRTYDDGINPPNTRYWVYRDQLNPVAELDAAGNVTTQFIYATGAHVPSYMIKGGSTYRFVTDLLGSMRLVIKVIDGTIAQQIDYDPWGVPTLATGTWDVQPFRFAGGLYDPDTGLYRLGARDYDPESGRWTAKDPSLFNGGINLFEYAAGDPINLVDVSGLAPSQSDLLFIADLLGVGGIAQGVVARRDAPMAAAHGDPDAAASQAACAGAAMLGGVADFGMDSMIGAGIGASLGVLGAAFTPKRMIRALRKATGKGNDFFVKTQREAEELLRKARPDLPWRETYADPRPKFGAEIHPIDGSGHDMPHIKWYDWRQGKSKGATGHIYFEGLY